MNTKKEKQICILNLRANLDKRNEENPYNSEKSSF